MISLPARMPAGKLLAPEQPPAPAVRGVDAGVRARQRLAFGVQYPPAHQPFSAHLVQQSAQLLAGAPAFALDAWAGRPVWPSPVQSVHRWGFDFVQRAFQGQRRRPMAFAEEEAIAIEGLTGQRLGVFDMFGGGATSSKQVSTARLVARLIADGLAAATGRYDQSAWCPSSRQ